MGSEAVDLYWKVSKNIRNEITQICVLNACSHAGLIDQARVIFDQINSKTERIFTTMVKSMLKYPKKSSNFSVSD